MPASLAFPTDKLSRDVSAPRLAGPLSWARLARLALPATMAALCATLFTTANAYWVGRTLGPDALGAVSLSFFWSWALLAISEVLGIGLIALASQAHGQCRPRLAAQICGQAVVLGIALSLILALAVPPSLPMLFQHMHLAPGTILYALPYLTITLYGAPVLVLSVVLDSVFRAEGDTTTPFKLTALSLAGAFVLTPLLIKGFGPIPALGIKGAAWSVIFTQLVATVIGFIWAFRRGLLVFSWPTSHITKTLIRIGLPTATTGIVISTGYIVITRFMAPYGTPGLAALGIGDQIEAWLFMVSLGLGEVVASSVGQNLGAGDIASAKRTANRAMTIALGLGFTACLLSYTLAPLLASQFTSDQATINETVRYLRLTAIAQLFFCLEIVIDEAMSGAGYTFVPMVISTTLTVSRIPIAYFAIRYFGLPGLWLTFTVTTLLRSSALFFLWQTGRWAKNLTPLLSLVPEPAHASVPSALVYVSTPPKPSPQEAVPTFASRQDLLEDSRVDALAA